DAIKADLSSRTQRTHLIAEDCSKKSTKAGYDAAGMALGYIPLQPVLTRLEELRVSNGHYVAAQVGELAEEIQTELFNRVKIARDGGDLLKTWDTLVDRLHLNDTDFITNWETHVRQASQGDMYSESNAHPHQEVLDRDTIRIYKVVDDNLTYTEQERSWGETLFSDTHNGDINDA